MLNKNVTNALIINQPSKITFQFCKKTEIWTFDHDSAESDNARPSHDEYLSISGRSPADARCSGS
jgi:hypothetical protein